MKTSYQLLPLLIFILVAGCGHFDHHDHHDEEGKLTLLDIGQVNKLAPYMVDLKKEGSMEATLDTLRLHDKSMVLQHRAKQSFSFKVMVDKDDHPVMPDSTSTSERRAGGRWHQGSIVVWCLGGCIMVNTQLCLLDGCKPMDNACGCIPPACGVCEDWGCSSIVSGFVSGGLVIQ